MNVRIPRPVQIMPYQRVMECFLGIQSCGSVAKRIECWEMPDESKALAMNIRILRPVQIMPYQTEAPVWGFKAADRCCSAKVGNPAVPQSVDQAQQSHPTRVKSSP